MLRRTGKADMTMTLLDWETEFSQMASMMDDVPLAKGRPTNAREFTHEILTPNAKTWQKQLTVTSCRTSAKRPD